MKHLCYYCQTPLQIKNECHNCPVVVKHFYNKANAVRCIELITYFNDERLIVDIYLDNGDCFYNKCVIRISNSGDSVSFKENPGITPHNVNEKLQFILM